MAKILRTESMFKCIGCFTCMLVCAAVNSKSHSLQQSRIKIRTYGGVSGKFVDTVCHACRDAACVEVCPSDALIPRKGGGVVIKKEACIGCKRCVRICSVGAIDFCESTKLPLICHHCGVCAIYCPHNCMYLDVVPDEIPMETEEVEE